MAVNKNSTSYTITFAVILVAFCGAWLAFLATSLKEKQTKNIDNEKRQFILSSAGAYTMDSLKTMEQPVVEKLFDGSITGQVFNNKGEVVDSVEAFDIDIVKEYKSTLGDKESQRRYPLFTYSANGVTKYIIPMAGNGLWGPVWGFIALNEDKVTIDGVVFDHKSETPGLGAKITDPVFTDKFFATPKKIIDKNGNYAGVKVVKGTVKKPAHEIDAIAGATITSKGVGKMLEGGFKPYALAWGLIK